MDEFDAVCLQGYAAITVASSGAILEVSLYRVAVCRQLGANLVFSSGKQIDFKKSVSVAPCNSLVAQY